MLLLFNHILRDGADQIERDRKILLTRRTSDR
jgi:hypothetical protein